MSNRDEPRGARSSRGEQGGQTPSLTPTEFAWRVVLTVLIVAVAYLLWSGIHVLLLAFAGVLLAVLLSSLAGWLSRWTGGRYGVALAIVVIGLAGVLAVFGGLLANRLAIQIAELAKQLPVSLSQIHEYLDATPWGRLLLEQAPQAAKSFAGKEELSQITGFVAGVGSLLEALIIIVVVGIFGAASPSVYKQGLIYLVPPEQRTRIEQALDAVIFNLRRWLVGQLILMVIIGATTVVGLWLIGIPLALSLGVIAGVFELVPYVGAWLAAIPAVLMALLVGPWYALATAGLYLGLHVLEGYALGPLVQRSAVHLPPALSLVAQFLLGELHGILGLFVAAPLTVVVVVFVKMLYVADALGDDTVEVPGSPEQREEAETAPSPPHE